VRPVKRTFIIMKYTFEIEFNEEAPEGYEYVPVNLTRTHEYGDYVYNNGKWNKLENVAQSLWAMPTMRLVRKQSNQPTTTLEDLVGENYDKTLWLYLNDGTVTSADVQINEDLGIALCGVLLKDCIKSGYRWSHNPTVKYEDANEFVV